MSQPNLSTQPPADGGNSEQEKLAALKRLLLSDERAEIQDLRKQFEESGLTTEQLSEMLPKAVWNAANRDTALAESMGPLIGESIKSAITNDAESIAEAISPIMGPAIRQTIQQAIRGMVQSFNKTLEYSVSAKGLTWRWEALRTGKSFAEVVLLHTLRYRVVQAFLIDKESGLLILHASLDDDAENVDLASGMLTAIQDFVRDSFGASDDDSLSEMSFGNQNVWLETGAHAYLAVVIEGEPPADLRTELAENLEMIHRRFNQELDGYGGDSGPLAPAQPIIDSCLVSAYESDDKKKDRERKRRVKPERTRLQKSLFWAAVAATLAGVIYLNYRVARRNHLAMVRHQLGTPDTVQITLEGSEVYCKGQAHQKWIDEANSFGPRIPGITSINLVDVENLDSQWNSYVRLLKDTPGLVVTANDADKGFYHVEGLRDPLSEDPTTLLERFEISNVAAKWTPFHSLDPAIVAKRVKQNLNAAPDPGLTPVPKNLPTNRLAVERIERTVLRSQINDVYFEFAEGSDRLIADESVRIAIAAEQIQRIIAAAKEANLEASVLLIGTAPGTVTDIASLGKRRARAIWRELKTFGIPASSVVLGGRSSERLTSLPPVCDGEMSDRICVIRIRTNPRAANP